MKLTLKIMLIGLIAVMASCSEADHSIYNGKTAQQTLLQFGSTTYALPVSIGATGSVEISVTASTVKNEDRTFNIEVIDSLTTADPSTYTVPSTITIPAGKYIGTATIEGVDNGLTVGVNELIALKLEDPDGDANKVVTEDDLTEITQQVVCPVPETFLVGKWKLTNVTQSVGGSSYNNFKEGVVNITVGENPTDRVFNIDVFDGLGTATYPVTISLNCNKFVLNQVYTYVYCTDALYYGPAAPADQSTYDLTNIQTSYIITYTEDLTGDCEAAGTLASFKLTKVN